MKVNYKHLGDLAQSFQHGFLTYHAAMEVFKHPNASQLFPKDDTGKISYQKGPGQFSFIFSFYANRINADPTIKDEFEKNWCKNSIVTFSSALEKYQYKDKHPIFELIYQMRNAVAHGNKFYFTEKALKRLQTYPANNADYSHARGWRYIEITPALHGTNLLFDFVETLDVYNIFTFITLYAQSQ